MLYSNKIKGIKLMLEMGVQGIEFLYNNMIVMQCNAKQCNAIHCNTKQLCCYVVRMLSLQTIAT